MVKVVTTKEELTKEIESGVAILDFYADWCGPCKMIAPVFEELAGEMADVKFIKINIDNSKDLAKEYGVMSIPTLVMVKDGETKEAVSGFRPKPALAEFINKNK